jgi:hypothetical protein
MLSTLHDKAGGLLAVLEHAGLGRPTVAALRRRLVA